MRCVCGLLEQALEKLDSAIANRSMQFSVQLAHGSKPLDVKDFTTVARLYTAIATAFTIDEGDIAFITLGTRKVDMDHLLGGQIGLGDLLFAHITERSDIITKQASNTSTSCTICFC